eukprot:TRINITY_DN32722_c0_g1_i1.p2 TRINITY_DN32722_c0_g1~~TRINITY_DN32722_c0_g1_i1.p2  ORF type:complete len:332 (+),score=91.82 TRINITY_DN32722_c0_g1_i1:71-1066(+)
MSGDPGSNGQPPCSASVSGSPASAVVTSASADGLAATDGVSSMVESPVVDDNIDVASTTCAAAEYEVPPQVGAVNASAPENACEDWEQRASPSPDEAAEETVTLASSDTEVRTLDEQMLGTQLQQQAEKQLQKLKKPRCQFPPNDELADQVLGLQMELESLLDELEQQCDDNDSLRGELSVVRRLLQERRDDGEFFQRVAHAMQEAEAQQDEDGTTSSGARCRHYSAGLMSSSENKDNDKDVREKLADSSFVLQLELDSVVEQLKQERELTSTLLGDLDGAHHLLRAAASSSSGARRLADFASRLLQESMNSCCGRPSRFHDGAHSVATAG